MSNNSELYSSGGHLSTAVPEFFCFRNRFRYFARIGKVFFFINGEIVQKNSSFFLSAQLMRKKIIIFAMPKWTKEGFFIPCPENPYAGYPYSSFCLYPSPTQSGFSPEAFPGAVSTEKPEVPAPFNTSQETLSDVRTPIVFLFIYYA